MHAACPTDYLSLRYLSCGVPKQVRHDVLVKYSTTLKISSKLVLRPFLRIGHADDPRLKFGQYFH